LLFSLVYAPVSFRPDAKKEKALRELVRNDNFIGVIKNCNDDTNAEWLRAVFHDAGTFNPATHRGGLDGSLFDELSREENSGLLETMHFYINFIRPDLALADIINAGGVLSVYFCGGPVLPLSYGRNDATAVSETGRIPGHTDSLESLLAHGDRFKMRICEKIAVYAGSHALGGVKRANNPDVFLSGHKGNRRRSPFDPHLLSFTDREFSFNNRIFDFIKANKAVLASDNILNQDPQARACILSFSSQTTFFENYVSGYQKMVDAGYWRVLNFPDIEFPVRGSSSDDDEPKATPPCPPNDISPDELKATCARDIDSKLSPGVCVSDTCFKQCMHNKFVYKTTHTGICKNNEDGRMTIVLKEQEYAPRRSKRSNVFFPMSSLVDVEETDEQYTSRIKRAVSEDLDEEEDFGLHDEL
jgi:hypothetical protein